MSRIEDLLSQMTVAEKIGQMTQVEKNSIKPGDITKYFIGSILSGGGGYPQTNTAQAWYEMVDGFQKEALATRLQIPILYGVDAVHGHGNLANATIFPHNIGLGATNNPDLVEKIGRATAEEILATAIPWNFAPAIPVVQDIRWGRTYEGFSENTHLVTSLGTAYLRGMQTLREGDAASPNQSIFALATPKHFIGDGATAWGTARTLDYKLDQGDMLVSESVLRELFLPPYQSAVDAGALCVMASFNGWNGLKMHAHRYLMTDVLKEQLGFQGFIVSDWQAMDQIHPDDYYKSVVASVNAGVDMCMVPFDYLKFIEAMARAVDSGDITAVRLNDAVRRILRAKLALGLFEQPMPNRSYQATVRSQEHLELARQAVRESLVLLTNRNRILPLKKDTPVVFLGGQGADDIGLQCGGWTLEWQGKPGNQNEGTSILRSVQAAVDSRTRLEYSPAGDFSRCKDGDANPLSADVGILVLAEEPYAEGMGDRADLSLNEEELRLLTEMRRQCQHLVVILVSGRPRVITDQIHMADAWVAAWLPGTEGAGISDVLFGDYPFSGKTAFTWPRSNGQLPINGNNAADKTGYGSPLFPFGSGLRYGESAPEMMD